MKPIHKIILLFFMSLLLSNSSKAQVQLGIEGGVNLSTIQFTQFDELFDISHSSGFCLGTSIKYSLAKSLNIGTDILLSQEGFKVGTSQFSPQYERMLLVRFNPQIEYQPLPFLGIQTGLSFSQVLTHQRREEAGDWQKVPDELQWVKDNDIGLLFGLTYYLKKFQLSVNYNHGIKDINNLTFTDDVGEKLETVHQHSRNWQLGIGYTLF